MRKTPVYNIHGEVKEWLADNNQIMYTEVLESIESAVSDETSFTGIPVIILQTGAGTTLFILKSVNAAADSLDKAMSWFAETEAYEKAARARDAKQRIVCLKQASDAMNI